MNHTSSHPLVDDGDEDGDNSPEAYAIPNPPADAWPSHWNDRAQDNWLTFAKPVFDRLEGDTRLFFTEIYRPKQTFAGLREREQVKTGTPEDYVAEVVLDQLCEDREIIMTPHRKVGRMKATRNVTEIGEQIGNAMIAVADTHPDEYPYGVNDWREVEPENAPLTRECYIAGERLKDRQYAECESIK
jgi:hypothetical protein